MMIELESNDLVRLVSGRDNVPDVLINLRNWSLTLTDGGAMSVDDLMMFANMLTDGTVFLAGLIENPVELSDNIDELENFSHSIVKRLEAVLGNSIVDKRVN